MCDFMKTPCKHCPFRIDVVPFLHPDRAYQIAAAAYNPYNYFWCHKTTVSDDDGEGSSMVANEDSKICAGFLTIRAHETDEGIPEGFEPAWDLVYEDAFDMYEAYQEKWDEKHS